MNIIFSILISFVFVTSAFSQSEQSGDASAGDTSLVDQSGDTSLNGSVTSAASSFAAASVTSSTQPQYVHIEAKIVQITLDEEHSSGVDWAAIVSNFQSLNFKENYEYAKNSESFGRLSFGTITNDDYTILLEALDTVGMMEIVGTPSTSTPEGKPMTITVSSLQPKMTTTTTTPFFGSTTTAEQLDIPDWGVQLLITPNVGEEKNLVFQIKPQINTQIKKSNENALEDSSIPSATINIQQGVIVIGGLIKEDKIRTIHKLPFFGDLPVVGMAFRNQNRISRKIETVIFLTPRIVQASAAASQP